MKVVKHIIFLVSLLIFSVFQMNADVICDSNPSGSDDDTTYLKRDPIKNDPNRPKAPDMQMIFCQYDGEELTFSFAYSEGECEVQLTDRNGMMQFYTIDSSELFASIYVGKIGYTEITLTTERGVTYTGVINRAQ